jgi:uncharacterized protein YndB with AHSA1/START domain
MTVTTVHKDPEGLTMALTAELDASVERAWQLWADPRQLERWWGPPSHPATFINHELTPGGRATYFMTGPDGEKYHGWWQVLAVDPPRRLEVRDGFADANGTPNEEMPTMRLVVTLTEMADGGTRMVVETHFSSTEAMDQVLSMGAEEGMIQAMSQIPAILAEDKKS